MTKFRLRLAAWIAGGTLLTYEGRTKGGIWLEGPVILTPKGKEAMTAAFWSEAKVYRDTALTKFRA